MNADADMMTIVSLGSRGKCRAVGNLQTRVAAIAEGLSLRVSAKMCSTNHLDTPVMYPQTLHLQHVQPRGSMGANNHEAVLALAA